MHTEKVNEILAHFIGLFETATDEARIRCEYLLGPTIAKAVPQDVADDTHSEDFKSLFELKSYDPEISYTLPAYDVPRLNTFEHGRACGHLSDTSGTVDPIAPDGATLPFRIVGNLGNSLDAADGPLIVGGPGSLISHLLQANVLYDDDVLNMTETAVPARDLSQVGEKLAQYLAEAVEASPFTQINQIDALQSLSAFVTSLTILAAGGAPLKSANRVTLRTTDWRRMSTATSSSLPTASKASMSTARVPKPRQNWASTCPIGTAVPNAPKTQYDRKMLRAPFTPTRAPISSATF